MKCTHCGTELPTGTTVCFECGTAQEGGSCCGAPQDAAESAASTPPAQRKKRCKNCGAWMDEVATVCFECGAAQNVASPANASAQGAKGGVTKSKLLATLLAFFLGGWGFDQFYLGFSTKGLYRIIVTVVTCGFGGAIWGWVDCYKIATGIIQTDASGNPIV